ncbi:Reverse transcriptase domain-containing protein [Durusdinium trenchii]|uniref:Reverse transcriptase domain-containing protein n=1 Tax=Durusdinium trenchii TaxID=1381693 RepID=A0ABP0PKU5_9DINO
MWLTGSLARGRFTRCSSNVCDVALFPDRVEATIHVPVEWERHVSCGLEFRLERFRVSWCGSKPHFHFLNGDDGGMTCLYLVPSVKREAPCLFEAFAGIGGWSEALSILGIQPAVLIDNDPVVIRSLHRKLNFPVMHPDEFLSKALHFLIDGPVIVFGSVGDEKIWVALGIRNAIGCFASPPCQPWSSAANRKGLSCEDGMIFQEMMQYAGRLSVSFLGAENVPGLRSHPDFDVLVRSADSAGLKLQCEGVYDCKKVNPVLRERWLGVFVGAHLKVAPQVCESARKIHWNESGLSRMYPGPTLAESNAVHKHITAIELEQLIPDQAAMQILSKVEFLPTLTLRKSSLSEAEAFRTRVRSFQQPMVGVMAQYTRQHLLPETLLRERGLKTHLVQDLSVTRYFSPWEVLAALGHSKVAVLPLSNDDAFRIVGNAIAVGHSMLCVAQTAHIVEEVWPFASVPALSQLYDLVVGHAMKLTQLKVEQDHEVRWLIEIEEDVQSPSPKRLRSAQSIEISPTVPFSCVEEASEMRGLDDAADFLCPYSIWSNLRIPIDECKGGIVVLKHCNKAWCICVHGSPSDTVGVFVQTALPLSSKEDFVKFQRRGVEVVWEDRIEAVPVSEIVFWPKVVTVNVFCSRPERIWQVKVDVTWKVQTLISFLAGSIGVPDESVLIQVKNSFPPGGSFLQACEGDKFELRFLMQTPMQVQPLARHGDRDLGLRTVDNGHVRIFARHPNHKLICTVNVRLTEECASVIPQLFPDMCQTHAWTCGRAKGEEVAKDTIEMLLDGGNDCFFVAWDTLAPYRRTAVKIVMTKHEAGSELFLQAFPDLPTTQRWIRSPWNIQACLLMVPAHIELGEIGASFIAGSQMNTSMTVHCGSTLFDPLIKAHDVGLADTISFKIAPLKGGAFKVGPDCDDEDLIPLAAPSGMSSFRSAVEQLGVQIAPATFARGGCLILVHCSLMWAIESPGEFVGGLHQFVMKALPHARESHFAQFTTVHGDIGWHDIVEALPPQYVVFVPETFNITCVPDAPWEVITFSIDVTWTILSCRSAISQQWHCTLDCIELTHKSLPTRDEDYVMEFDSSTFHIGFRMCIPACVGVGQTIQLSQQLKQFQEKDYVRRAWKDPRSKRVLTDCVGPSTPLWEVLQTLWPGISPTTHEIGLEDSWNDGGLSVADLLAEGVCLVSIRDLRPNVKDAVSTCHLMWATLQPFNGSVGDECTSIWMRTPFQAKPVVVKVPEVMPLVQLTNHVFSHTKIAEPVLVLSGSHVLSPNVLCGDLGSQEVLSFRLFPIKGGGKPDVPDKIKALLISKGVPKDVVDTRVSDFAAKCPLSRFKVSDDEGALWEALKKAANEAAFRLVQHAELKAWVKEQKGGTQKPPSSSKTRVQKPLRSESDFRQLQEIVIDVGLFRDADQTIPQLEVTDFDRDGRGLAIMNVEQAAPFIGNKSLSADALAILVVDQNLRGFREDDLVTVPAHTKEGKPIVVHAALIQCGDRPVSFTSNLPSLQVKEVSASVVEFVIERPLVGSWDEAAIPLHYLGVCIPSLRGAKLLASWAIKSYDEQRKPAPFKKAAQWHGYIRIPDSILCEVLSRSGAKGIFLQVKGCDKKLDSRFTAIPLPTANIQEALQQAKAQTKALGIVRLGPHFGVRCKREVAADLRAALVPDSTYVDASVVDGDKSSFLLKGLRCDFQKDELTEALKKIGWPAQAIRQVGGGTWVLAAEEQPPNTHIYINSNLCTLEIQKKKGESEAVVAIAKQMNFATTLEVKNGDMKVQAVSRYQEVQAEISTQVKTLVDQQMQQANQKISELSTQMDQLRADNAACATKIGNIEANQSSMVSSIQSMFSKMESSMTSHLQQSVAQSMTAVEENLARRLSEMEAAVHKKQKLDS